MKAIKCGSSNLQQFKQELEQGHKDFLEVQSLIEQGMKITGIRKVRRPKRPRIKKERTPIGVVIAVMGGRLTLKWKDYLDKGQSFKVITKIYE